MGEAELYKNIIYQAIKDLYSKVKGRKSEAKIWIYGTAEDLPEVTFEECCDLSGLSKYNFIRIADAIVAGRLTKTQYKKAMEAEEEEEK